MQPQVNKTFSQWLVWLFFRPEVWLFIVLLTTISANWWQSVYLMIPFTLASIFAWITYDAAYPTDDCY